MFGGEKLDKVVATVAPDDVVKVAIGDLAGVDRPVISGLNSKEDQKDYDAVRTGYLDLFKKSAAAPEPDQAVPEVQGGDGRQQARGRPRRRQGVEGEGGRRHYGMDGRT